MDEPDGLGGPERVEATAVTADLFGILGIQPMMGRSFTEEEDRPGGARTVVLGYGFWKRHFGNDPRVLGRKLILDGMPYEVIGVMPAGFHFPRPEVEMWMAMRFTPADMMSRDNHYLQVLGRLRRGVGIEQARADMRVIAGRLEKAYPRANLQTGVSIRPLREEIGRNARCNCWCCFRLRAWCC